jgi:hypothetical protein
MRTKKENYMIRSLAEVLEREKAERLVGRNKILHKLRIGLGLEEAPKQVDKTPRTSTGEKAKLVRNKGKKEKKVEPEPQRDLGKEREKRELAESPSKDVLVVGPQKPKVVEQIKKKFEEANKVKPKVEKSNLEKIVKPKLAKKEEQRPKRIMKEKKDDKPEKIPTVRRCEMCDAPLTKMSEIGRDRCESCLDLLG